LLTRQARTFVCFSFFFSSRRRHTRFSRDWSSDVCSSDLAFRQPRCACEKDDIPVVEDHPFHMHIEVAEKQPVVFNKNPFRQRGQIGRASCRERVEISVGASRLEKREAE